MVRDNDHQGPEYELLQKIDRGVQPLKALIEKAATKKQLETLAGQVENLADRLTRLGSELRQSEQERARQQEALRRGLLAARDLTASRQRDIRVISDILTSGLPPRPPAFSDLKVSPRLQSFHPGEPPSSPSPIPKPKPSLLGRFGGTGKDEQKMADWRDKTEEAEEEHRQALASYQQRRDQEQYRIDRENAKAQADADRQNRQVEEMETAYAEGAPEAVSWFVLQALARSEYPGWYPPQDRQYKVLCRPERQDVFIELELPPPDVVPQERGYQYILDPDGPLPLPMPRDERSQRYTRLIADIALRTMSEVRAATAPHPGLVQKITLNGRVQGTDPATGAEFRPHLLSVSAHRDVLPCDSRLGHAQLQADACLAWLDARISVDPLALLEVEPKEPFPQTPPQEGNGPSQKS